jgi:DNA-binding response OmpR family regulator
MRILLIEDDALLSSSLRSELQRQGFAIDISDNGVDGEFMGNEVSYDVVVLDLGLPKRSGLDVLKNWRKHHNHVPVIILTARDAWHERVDGFKAGADDYVGKPFHVEELVMRIRALIHRSHAVPGSDLRQGTLELDEDRQQVKVGDGEPIALTGTEFRLLRYFMHNPGKVLPKLRLIEHVYGDDFDKGSNLIEVYVRRLREKLGKEYIRTQRGQGYVFSADSK